MTRKQIIAALAKHGYLLEQTGGNCEAFVRREWDGFSTWITTEDDPSIPESLDERITIGEYEDDQDVDGTGDDLTNGYTLRDALAALDYPSDEYVLLSLRLDNGFHHKAA
jgi:hypothetical protein